MFRISAVNYLNSKPFIHGLKSSGIINDIDLQLDIPAVCADKLISGAVDIGLVPVAVLPELDEAHIIGDYCIGADGAVGSVLLLSDYPIDEIKTVLLDNQSRTSVMLAEILFEKYWKRNPTFSDGYDNIEERIAGETAAVVIGDKALRMRHEFNCSYDLAEEWKNFTQLPFVFACWVSNKKLPEDFVKRFNDALKVGVDSKLMVAEQEKINYPNVDIADYFTNKISYTLDDRKRKALDLFLSYVAERMERDLMKIV